MNARRNSGRTWSGWGRRVNLCLRRPGVDAVPVGGDWRRYRGLGAVRGGVGHHDAVRREFPLGTLAINVTGSFLIGFLMTTLTERFQLDPRWRLLLVVGFLGGYTTFSSLEWETYTTVREGGLWTGMLNVVSSVMLGYVAVSLGSMLARR